MPTPPTNPIVRRVIDPATKDYALHVLLDKANAGTKWKVFETTLAEFGNITGDLGWLEGEHTGYTLVDHRLDPRSEQVEFIFRKLPGNVRTTKSLGSSSIIPDRFSDQVERVLTRTDVVDSTEPTPITGTLIMSQVEQLEGTGLAVKADIDEIIDSTAGPLVGAAWDSRFGGGMAGTYEQLAYESTDAPNPDFLTLELKKTPIGRGFAIIDSTQHEDSTWPILSGQRVEQPFGLAVPFTEQVVPSGTAMPAGVEVEPIDHLRSKHTSSDLDSSTIEAFHWAVPANTRVSLPETLLGVDLYWTASGGIGRSAHVPIMNGEALSNYFSGRCNGNVSATGDVVPKRKKGYDGSVPSEVHYFFMHRDDASTAEAVALRLASLAGYSISTWPQFRPKAVSFVLFSEEISVSVDAGNSFEVSSTDPDYYATTNQTGSKSTNAIEIPPTIHGNLTPAPYVVTPNVDEISTEQFDASTATFKIQNVGAFYTWISSTSTWDKDEFVFGPIIEAKAELRSEDDTVLIGSTNPSSIPASGHYIVTAEGRPFRDDYLQFTVETVDFSLIPT